VHYFPHRIENFGTVKELWNKVGFIEARGMKFQPRFEKNLLA
jgi:hypothetical protein